MLNAQTIVPTIRKYTNGLRPLTAVDSKFNHLEYEMIRLALRSADLELKGELYDDAESDEQYHQLLAAIQTAIQEEAVRLYGSIRA